MIWFCFFSLIGNVSLKFIRSKFSSNCSSFWVFFWVFCIVRSLLDKLDLGKVESQKGNCRFVFGNCIDLLNGDMGIVDDHDPGRLVIESPTPSSLDDAIDCRLFNLLLFESSSSFIEPKAESCDTLLPNFFE